MERYKRERDAVIAASAQKKGKIGDKNDEVVRLTRLCLKNHVFKTFKYVTTVPGEIRLTEAVMDNINIKGLTGDEPEVAVERENFMRNYQKIITSQLNEVRNNTQSRVKEVVKGWVEAAKKPRALPPLKDLVAICNRKLDLKDPKALEIALFWVDKILPACTGTSQQFAPSVRYFQTISKAKSNPEATFGDMTPETEAFALVCIENNYKKWPKLWELERKEPNKKLKTVVMKEKKDDHVEKPDSKYYYISDYPDLATKYTNPDSGQEKYGGWNEQGIRRFIEIKNINANKRASDAGKAWEAELLEELRKSKNITAATWEEQQKLNGKAKANKAASAAGITNDDLFDFELSSDNDDDIAVVDV